MDQVKAFAEGLLDNIEKVIIGKRASIELLVVGLLTEGHILIEDVPGVGKTMLARSLAASLGCSFNRIQFTPDMLPSDVTGVSIFNQVSREFEFRPGPIIAQIVLADEINRATPKTQSALLEAMQERQITIDGITHPLPHPFLVLATQNPIEYEGTFPLPEAQLDRFLIRLRVGYPARADEINVLNSQQHHHPLEDLEQYSSAETLQNTQSLVKNVHVSHELLQYIVDISRATREHNEVYLGASTRGSLALFHASQALAAIRGRDFVLPDDVKELVIPCLSHRIILDPGAMVPGLTADDVLEQILSKLKVPGGDIMDGVENIL